MFTGQKKLAVARRLRDNWQDLADYFDMPVDQRHSFAPGREPQGVWEWLEARGRLPELLDALRYIDRADIVVEVLAPPATPASPPGVTWQGSPFPGLRHFTPGDAAIFFGRAMLARAAQSPRLRTVLTLRADFYHRCVDFPDLATLLRAGSFPLAVPDLPALLEMITGRAAVAGLTFQADLAGRILRGGSWDLALDYARASCRVDLAPVSRFSSVGRRVVRSSPSLA